MGVKVANIEANLCYTHSSDAEMVSRLPFDPEGDEVEHATWIDEAVLGSEDAPPTAPVVPAVFKWVELRPREGRLVVGLDPNQQLPARWSMTVTLGAIKTRVLDDTRLSSVPDEGCVTVAIGVPVVTSVLVEWEDEKGIQSGHLPILVADPSALPPPEELRALGADGILDCLLSGRSPIEWAETQAERKTRSAGQAHDLDSLRSVDTSEYAVYRLRRFGRALGQLAQRLLGAPRIVDAFQYRLAHDPLGPIALADAIGRDWAKYDPSHASFALAELVLCVSHVGRRIHRERAAGDPDLRTHFNETVRRIAALIASAEGTPKLSKYVRAVKQECGSLLALDLEATNAG
jgi:hypothetical protein